MSFPRKKFSDEIHVGLLLIIIILILLNFLTNYILFYTRERSQENTLKDLSKICIDYNNNLKFDYTREKDESFEQSFKKKYDLSSLIILSDNPNIDNKELKLNWLKDIIAQLPTGQIPEIARQILNAKYNTLQRGENDEFFVTYSFSIRNQQKLLIISKEFKELSFLKDASNVVMIASIIAIALLSIVYFKFYRFLMSPFKEIKSEAVRVGRMLDSEDDDIESILKEYHQIIIDLRRQEDELKLLNRQIKNRAENLQEYNNYLLDSMSSGILMTDEVGTIIKVNQSLEIILSCDQDKLLDTSLSENENIPESIKDFIKKCLNDVKCQPYQEFQININGSDRFIGITISTILNHSSQQIGLSLFINDLTELKQLQLKLERSNQLAALGEMSAGLAHQLRNSIGAISGYSSLIEKRLKKESVSSDIVMPIKDEIREAEHLISKFLNFTKPFNANFELVPITDMITNWVNKYKMQLLDSKVTVNLKFDQLPIKDTMADDLLLKQSFYNILDNAVLAYGEQPGVIDIHVFEKENSLYITISDKASGIKPEDLNRIFTPFYSSRPDGSGLGLPLAKRIVILHSGDIEVTSEVNFGTTFSIILPLIHSNMSNHEKKEIVYQ